MRRPYERTVIGLRCTGSGSFGNEIGIARSAAVSILGRALFCRYRECRSDSRL
jgi:hypothetical protein